MKAQNENAEQEWIAKYRAAIDEIPGKRTLPAKVHAALKSAWRRAGVNLKIPGMGSSELRIREPLRTPSPKSKPIAKG